MAEERGEQRRKYMKIQWRIRAIWGVIRKQHRSFLQYIHIGIQLKLNCNIMGETELQLETTTTKGSFQYSECAVSKWVAGKRNLMGTSKQLLFPRLLVGPHKLTVRSYCCRKHLHNSVDMAKYRCAYLNLSPVWTTYIHGTRHTLPKANNSPALNPSDYKNNLPARYAHAAVAESF